MKIYKTHTPILGTKYVATGSINYIKDGVNFSHKVNTSSYSRRKALNNWFKITNNLLTK